jgi:hypothetical protein
MTYLKNCPALRIYPFLRFSTKFFAILASADLLELYSFKIIAGLAHIKRWHFLVPPLEKLSN